MKRRPMPRFCPEPWESTRRVHAGLSLHEPGTATRSSSDSDVSSRPAHRLRRARTRPGCRGSHWRPDGRKVQLDLAIQSPRRETLDYLVAKPGPMRFRDRRASELFPADVEPLGVAGPGIDRPDDLDATVVARKRSEPHRVTGELIEGQPDVLRRFGIEIEVGSRDRDPRAPALSRAGPSCQRTSSPTEAPCQSRAARRSCDAARPRRRAENRCSNSAAVRLSFTVCRAIAWMMARRFFDRCVTSRIRRCMWVSRCLREVMSRATPISSAGIPAG